MVRKAFSFYKVSLCGVLHHRRHSGDAMWVMWVVTCRIQPTAYFVISWFEKMHCSPFCTIKSPDFVTIIMATLIPARRYVTYWANKAYDPFYLFIFRCELYFRTEIDNTWQVSEWVIKFNGLSGESGQRGPYSPYKPCNHSVYIQHTPRWIYIAIPKKRRPLWVSRMYYTENVSQIWLFSRKNLFSETLSFLFTLF